MSNAELINALRHCGRGDVISESCLPCNYYGRKPYCEGALLNAAADALESAEKRIAELEAQIPKEGEWIWDSDTGTYNCSECNATSPREDQDGEYIDCPNFCPNCGARMKHNADAD